MNVTSETKKSSVPTGAVAHKLPIRNIVAASIGNAIEWYDWTIYAAFAVYFSTQFFPKGDPAIALIQIMATYAVAFFFRPIGGWLLGRFADVNGRKSVMIITILLLGGGSLVIGILPTFSQVGWLSPLLLVLARIAQGISLGGEVSNASAYLAEIAPDGRRGRYSSFFYISMGLALLLGSSLGAMLSTVLTHDQMLSFGWRIPFIIGGVMAAFGAWLRLGIAESKAFEDNKKTAQTVKRPLLTTLTQYPKQVMQMVGITLLNTLAYYTFFSSIPPYALGTQHISGQTVFVALTIGTAVFTLLQYPFGALSDRIGRKPQLLLWSGGLALAFIPLSKLITPDAGLMQMTIVFSVGLALYALMASIAPAIMSELFPTALRGAGIGAWYNITVAVFGGTAPLLIASLAKAGRPDLFFVYVTIGAVIAFITVLTLKESAHEPMQ
jgi:MHS family alpha-ketoglutarate permease-like MFS transporter